MKRRKVLLTSFLAAVFVITLVSLMGSKNDVKVEAEASVPGKTVFYASTSARTIPEAFNMAGIEYFPDDKVTVFPELSFGLGSKITFERAQIIRVTDGKRELTYRSFTKTVGDLFDEKKITLLGEDTVTPSLTTEITPDVDIKITRVERTKVSENEVIEYKKTEKKDSTVYRGITTITQKGVNGERVKVYEIYRKDGELISKTLVSNTVTKAVVDQVTVIGTKLKIDSSKTRSGTASYYSSRYQMASNILPKGTKVLVTNTANGKSVEGVVEDYMAGTNHIIDMRPDLWSQISGGTLGMGIFSCKVEVVLN